MYQSIIIFSIVFALGLSNCVRLKAPPITFTQTATAAEKQMVGEDKDIERDGWILSSIRTSATGSRIWKRESLDRTIDYPDYDSEVYSALRKLAYFSGETYEFKKKGFIGESADGSLKLNPNFKTSIYYKEFPENEKRIQLIIREVNKTRSTLRFKKSESIEANTKLTAMQKAKAQEELQSAFFNTVERGEFFEDENGKWNMKQ
ncbi:MAG: DUF1318 domain-containing protein [Leptospira sp.]|nr:DUF1318 domain-containing protein [Leptospira sp.]